MTIQKFSFQFMTWHGWMCYTGVQESGLAFLNLTEKETKTYKFKEASIRNLR